MVATWYIKLMFVIWKLARCQKWILWIELSDTVKCYTSQVCEFFVHIQCIFLGGWGVKTSRIQKILEEVLSADYWSIWCATVGGGFFKYGVFFLENRLKYKVVMYWHVELILACFQDPFATLNITNIIRY